MSIDTQRTENRPVLLEHVACDLCGCGDYVVRYRAPDAWLWATPFEFPVVRCVKCGLVYVNPRPTAQALGAYYPAHFYADRDNNEAHERYRRQMARLPSLQSGCVLDIGCARGDFPALLKTTFPGLDVHGCDAYSDGNNHANIRFFPKHVYECEFPPEHFDLITSWAVFEHLLTPSRYFAEVARILKPDGSFVMLVPNAESLSNSVAHTEDVPRHTYHYSPRTLRAYAKRHGMRVEKIEYCDDIYDGRGHGTITAIARRILGITLRDLKAKRIGIVRRQFLRAARVIDRIVFATHWEVKLERSGVIVVTMRKD